jgi:hypothetical protein
MFTMPGGQDILKRRYSRKNCKTRNLNNDYSPTRSIKDSEDEDDGEGLWKLKMGELSSIISQQ